MKHSLVAGLVALGLVVATGSAAAADDFREIEASHPLAAGQRLHIDFHSGELEVEGVSGNRVEIELELECEWGRADCEEILEDIDVAWRAGETRLHLEVEGLRSWRRPRVEVTAIVRVPKAAPLVVDMTAGSLSVEDMTGDVRVELGAGEVRLWLPESAVGTVSIDVGVGDASLRGPRQFTSGRRSLLVGSEVYWNDGPGDARIDVEVGAGEATVWLD